jgi:hypothetical protein
MTASTAPPAQQVHAIPVPVADLQQRGYRVIFVTTPEFSQKTG